MTTGVMYGKSRPVHAWRELAAFLYLPADVIWMTGWFYLVTDGDTARSIASTYLVFVLISCMAYLILRLLFAWQVPAALRLGMGALGLMACLWLGVSLFVYQTLVIDLGSLLKDIWVSFRGVRALSGEFWSLGFIIIVWVRAILYTHNPVTQDTIMGRLQFGLFMTLILVLIYDRLDWITFMTGLCLFLILGLSSLGLARIADINLHRGGRRLLFTLDWFLAISGVSTGLVFVTGAISLLTSTWLSLAVIAVTSGILAVIRFIIEKLVVSFVNIFLAILYSLLKSFYHPESQAQVNSPQLELYDAFKDIEPFKLADPTAEGLKAAQPYVLGILLGLVAIAIVIMLLRLPRNEKLGNADGAGEKTGDNVWKQLRKSIGNRLQSLLERVSKQVNIRRAAGLFRAARIRWIYRQFEVYTARKGCPRQVAVTPLEYQSVATRFYTGGADDLALLTASYQSVRYGELPETAREVTRVVIAWDRLKKLKVARSVRPNRRQKP